MGTVSRAVFETDLGSFICERIAVHLAIARARCIAVEVQFSHFTRFVSYLQRICDLRPDLSTVFRTVHSYDIILLDCGRKAVHLAIWRVLSAMQGDR